MGYLDGTSSGVAGSAIWFVALAVIVVAVLVIVRQAISRRSKD